MASQAAAGRPTSSPGHDDAVPNPQYARPDVPGPPSIISSRMTDIASDEGDEAREQNSPSNPPRSPSASEAQSRPDTAQTGLSSSRGPRQQSQSLRKNYPAGLTAKRVSLGAGSISRSAS